MVTTFEYENNLLEMDDEPGEDMEDEENDFEMDDDE